MPEATPDRRNGVSDCIRALARFTRNAKLLCPVAALKFLARGHASVILRVRKMVSSDMVVLPFRGTNDPDLLPLFQPIAAATRSSGWRPPPSGHFAGRTRPSTARCRLCLARSWR